MVYRPYRTHRSGGGTTTVIVEVPVGDGDIDILYLESLVLADALSGTLGPVRAPDTFDIADEFVADELTLQESIDASDLLRPITDFFVGDGFDLTASLSGTLGPIRAPDTLDFGDTFVADELVFQESFDLASVIPEPTLMATAQETIDLSDNLGNITQFDDDSMHILDDFATDLRLPDGIDAADELRAVVVDNFVKTLDLEATSNFASDIQRDDSLDLEAELQTIYNTIPIGIDFATVTGPQDLDATEYAQAVESVSGENETITDCLENTPSDSGDLLSTSQGGLTGTNNNVENVDLIVSLGDFDISGALDTIDDVQVIWNWGWRTSTTVGSAAEADLDFQYSTDGGSNWTTAFNRNPDPAGPTGQTVPPSDDGLDITSVINNDWTKLQGFQMRVVGTITSGAGLVILPSTMRIEIYTMRVEVTASQA